MTTAGSIDTWTRKLFAAIDGKDVEGFLSFLDPDCELRFGNAPAVGGRSAVGATVAGFFDSLSGLRHDLEEEWRSGDTLVVRGDVSYFRKDGSVLAVPFVNILTLRNGLATRYLIYADLSAL